ncbi:hypothetical protein [Scytonema millei]|uniref:Uncharacterized protein n=1 Tax=Scytonema millei VB511283 TaxID=1245923 RepID=A0A9X5I469_9CYAN|nr:hypothetical protein [Scytonema millei]NHC34232.1 hypothetical protein [Scytonema millei VB511283]
MSVVVGAGLASGFTVKAIILVQNPPVQLSVVSCRRGGFSQRIYGSSHHLGSKPARTVVSYELSGSREQGAGSREQLTVNHQPSTVNRHINQFSTPYTLNPSFFNHDKFTNDE